MGSVVCDEMENNWGVQFLHTLPSKPMRKTQAHLDKAVKAGVPGFQLCGVQASGTHGNMVAMNLAANYDCNACLFGLGSYVGGDEYLQDISTTMYDVASCLSMPKFVENASDRCFEQTVPLPYHVPGAITEEECMEVEARCLRALHKKLATGFLSGKPWRALLVEIILGGNGAQLSPRFLEQLGVLCSAQKVKIVADEVLTGGRVGRHMAMTPSMPEAFRDAVEFITMGKFVGCSLILKKVPRKPTSVAERIRGTSTHQDCAMPFAIWLRVMEAKRKGEDEKRRDEVLQAMNLSKDPAAHWGQGLLMYSKMKRPQLMKGLKNRLLPMLEPGLKIRKLKCERSKWTREEVSKQIIETVDEWLVEQEVASGKRLETSFLSSTVDCIFFFGIQKLEPEGSNDYGYFRLRPEDVINFLGKQKAAVIAKELGALKVEQFGRGSCVCKMSALSFAKEALFLACARTSSMGGNTQMLVKKKRKTSKRIEHTFVHTKLFGCWSKTSGVFVFYS